MPQPDDLATQRRGVVALAYRPLLLTAH